MYVTCATGCWCAALYFASCADINPHSFPPTPYTRCSLQVYNATYHVSGKFAGLPVVNYDCSNACADSDFAVGGVLNMGHMYISGAQCPVKQPQKLSIVSHAYVSPAAPKGTLTTELVAKDASAAQNILLDLQVVATMN